MRPKAVGFRKISFLLFAINLTFSLFSQTKTGDKNSFPVVWTTYKKVISYEKDFADLKAHGVELINMSARDAADAREKLRLAREWGIKYHIGLSEITESAGLVRDAKLQPADALMIGGVYMGKAIDRHLFSFLPGKNTIIIEPPVYNKGFAYTTNGGSTGDAGKGEPIGHYYPDMPDPVKVEIIVPLRKFDGKQHLKIIDAEISEAPAGTKPEFDSVTPDMAPSSETAKRKLYRITFDLTGLDKAMLDQVGVAVYWPYHGTNKYWIFSRGNVSAAAESTRLALQKAIQKELTRWKEANDGIFPLDVVAAARLGDECFYITGHSQAKGSEAVSYPLWEYSDPTIQAFRKQTDSEYPRTWGFPEIYGEKSYSWWMYNLHQQTANLVALVHDEIAKTAPGLKLFRNTTRMGIFDLSNNFDGTGQELLTRHLDIVHLDPYPVAGGGYTEAIPRDMSYCAGLARRYNRLLIPWMQAHIYSRLQHVTPDQVDRMAQEQWDQGVDGIIWLGYGDTFPLVRPDSWEQAANFHRKLAQALPPKPKPKLAVLRSYNAMAAVSFWGNGQIRNPADWQLQQFLEVWAVKQKKAYDVFELPPNLSNTQQKELKNELKKYPYIVSTIPWKGAFFIGKNTTGTLVDISEANGLRQTFEKQINRLDW